MRLLFVLWLRRYTNTTMCLDADGGRTKTHGRPPPSPRLGSTSVGKAQDNPSSCLCTQEQQSSTLYDTQQCEHAWTDIGQRRRGRDPPARGWVQRRWAMPCGRHVHMYTVSSCKNWHNPRAPGRSASLRHWMLNSPCGLCAACGVRIRLSSVSLCYINVGIEQLQTDLPCVRVLDAYFPRCMQWCCTLSHSGGLLCADLPFKLCVFRYSGG